MSNNKQGMKLYTEEQVNKIAIQVKDYGYWDTKYITPIELPSDEEIGQEFKHGSENWEVRQALEVGAKWMRDKIQGGNK